MGRLFFISLCIVFSQYSHAQDGIAKTTINPVRLTLKKHATAESVLIGGAEGRATSKPQYLLLSGQDMFQPLLITLTAAQKNIPVTVTLHKDSWDTDDMSATTDEDGYCEFKIRASGEVGIKISAGQEADYMLMAVAGKEIMPELASPFVDKKNTKEAVVPAKEKEGPNTRLYLIIGVGLLFIIAVVLYLRKKKAAGMFLLGLLLHAGVQSQQVADGNTVEAIREETEKKIKERTKETYDKFGEKGEKAAKILISGVELWKAFKDLNTCTSSATMPGMPSVPSFCAADEDTEQDCAECFREARKEFNEVRYKFIKLSAIYRCTKEYADKAKSFGDDVSSIHAVQGLAWQAEKRKIEQSVDNLKKVYDDKYIELLERLHTAMMKLDACEADYGEEDWFDRYGFIFYEYMKESYRRKD